MPDQNFIDYYELLQISPKAETETIHRVYKMLATRYHPDHPETGDLNHFLLLTQAYEVLTDSNRRSDYDIDYGAHNAQPIELFETKDFATGVSGEPNRRMGILCLLYNRRRSNPDDPGISILEFEAMMSLPREHLMFTIWYLKDKQWIRQDDNSDYVITFGGVDYVEEHIPKNRLLFKLLKAGETGGTQSASRDGNEAATAESTE